MLEHPPAERLEAVKLMVDLGEDVLPHRCRSRRVDFSAPGIQRRTARIQRELVVSISNASV